MTHHDNPEPNSTPQRQRFRFNIASLVLVVFMLGLWLAWFARSARTQREALAAITKAHGQVLYDWQWRNGHWVPSGKKPSVPQWLVDAFGIDCFGSVTYVSIPHPSESELSHIGNLDQLRTLVITDQLELTDTGLAQLKLPQEPPNPRSPRWSEQPSLRPRASAGATISDRTLRILTYNVERVQ